MKDLKSTIDVDDYDEFENSALEELFGNDRDSEESDQEESDEPPRKRPRNDLEESDQEESDSESHLVHLTLKTIKNIKKN